MCSSGVIKQNKLYFTFTSKALAVRPINANWLMTPPVQTESQNTTAWANVCLSSTKVGPSKHAGCVLITPGLILSHCCTDQDDKIGSLFKQEIPALMAQWLCHRLGERDVAQR